MTKHEPAQLLPTQPPLFSLAQSVSKGTETTRNKRLFLTGSGVVHVGVATFLVITGMWKIEKLPMDRIPPNVVMHALPGDSGGGTPGKKPDDVEKSEVKKNEKKKVIVKTLVQFPANIEVSKTTETAAVDSQTNASNIGPGGGGDGRGVGVPTPDGAGCTMPPCGDGETPAPAESPEEKPVVVAPAIVPPSVIAGLRVSGETQIVPSDVVSNAIRRDGADKVIGSFKICLSAQGSVSSVGRLKTTGYPDYDANIIRVMQTWRYRSYTIGGSAVPVCSVVTFAYSN